MSGGGAPGPGGAVAITGLGMVSAAGDGVADAWRAFEAGDCGGVRVLDHLPAKQVPARLGMPVRGFDPAAHFGARRLRLMNRGAALGLRAAERAIADAGLAPADHPDPRRGVYYASAYGGITTLCEEIARILREPDRPSSPFVLPKVMHCSGAFFAGQAFGVGGPIRTHSTACSSASSALSEAVEALRSGAVDQALVVAADASLEEMILRSWQRLRVMAPARPDPAGAYRPFAPDRDGFVMGEAGVAFVLERAGERPGAPDRGRVLGHASRADLGAITAVSRAAQAGVMRAALSDAGVDPGAIEFVLAHGSGTRMNDPTEAAALRDVFGGDDPPWVSVSKPCFGHAMGASSGTELAVGLLAGANRRLPRPPNLAEPDPACALRFPPRAGGAPLAGGAFLVNSFAFAGADVCVVAAPPADSAGGRG